MRKLFLFGLMVSAATAAAQSPPDTAKKSAASNNAGDGDGSAVRWTSGVAAGALRFSDGAEERAVAANVGVHLWGWLDLSVNPTYAWATGAPVQLTPLQSQPGRKVRGLTDLPIDIGFSHGIPGIWAPSMSFSLGFTLPTGDSLTVGGGRGVGVGANIGIGVAPTENFSLNAGLGRSLSNGYSAALASSSLSSLSLGSSTKVGSVDVSVSYSQDVGTAEPGYENTRVVGGGLSFPLGGDFALNADGSGGLTPGAPKWAFALSLGTSSASIAAASVAPYQQLRRVFGKGRALIATKPTTRPRSSKKGSGAA